VFHSCLQRLYETVIFTINTEEVHAAKGVCLHTKPPLNMSDLNGHLNGQIIFDKISVPEFMKVHPAVLELFYMYVRRDGRSD
jgi:hypothetical protein